MGTEEEEVQAFGSSSHGNIPPSATKRAFGIKQAYEFLIRGHHSLRKSVAAPELVALLAANARVSPLAQAFEEHRRSASSTSSSSASSLSASDESGNSEFFWTLVDLCTCLPCADSVDATTKKSFFLAHCTPCQEQPHGGSMVWKEKWQSVLEIQRRFYRHRNGFLALLIELFRIASCAKQHVHYQLAKQVVVSMLSKVDLLQVIVQEVQRRLTKSPKSPNFLHNFAFAADFEISAEELTKFRCFVQFAHESQLAHEQVQLLKLLVLVLYYSRETRPFSSTTTFEQLMLLFVDSQFSLDDEFWYQTTVNSKWYQDRKRKMALLGTLVLLEMLNQLPSTAWSASALLSLTDDLFLTKVAQSKNPEDAASEFVPHGILLLAWAANVARHWQSDSGMSGMSGSEREVFYQSELETRLRNCVRMAENLESFNSFSGMMLLLSSRYQVDWYQAFDRRHDCWKSLLANSRLDFGYHGATYQHVALLYLHNVFVTLDYMDCLENTEQMNAMVRMALLVVPQDFSVEKTLMTDEEDAGLLNGQIHLLAQMLSKTRRHFPHGLYAFLKLATVLVSKSKTIRNVEFVYQLVKLTFSDLDADQDHNQNYPARTNRLMATRLLPPEEYLERVEENHSSQVVAVRTFAYPQDNVVVPAGTRGILSGGDRVDWMVDPNINASAQDSLACNHLWDEFVKRLDHLVLSNTQVAGFNSLSVHDCSIMTGFLELFIQLSVKAECGVKIWSQMSSQWAISRLRRWCEAKGIPEQAFALLVAHQVSLSELCCASREDLVAWGITDRMWREKLLSATSSSRAVLCFKDLSGTLEVDGVAHVMDQLFNLVQAFLNAPNAIEPEHLHLVVACIGALSSCASCPMGPELLVQHFERDWLQILLQATRTIHERVEKQSGKYPTILSTLQFSMNVVRWSLAAEVLVQAKHDSAFTSVINGRILGGITEFVVYVLSTCSKWSFAQSTDRFLIEKLCFGVLLAILQGDTLRFEEAQAAETLDELQLALRKAFYSDSVLQQTLLGCLARLLSCSGSLTNASAFMTVNEKSKNPAPTVDASLSVDTQTDLKSSELVFDFTSFGSGVEHETLELVFLEASAAVGLELIVQLLDPTNSGIQDGRQEILRNAVRGFFSTPFDVDLRVSGVKMSSKHTLVALCSELVGYHAYFEITLQSVKALQQCCLRSGAGGVESFGLQLSDAKYPSLVAMFGSKRRVVQFCVTLLSALQSENMLVSLKEELLLFCVYCLQSQPSMIAQLLLTSKQKPNSGSLLDYLQDVMERSLQELEENPRLVAIAIFFVMESWQKASQLRGPPMAIQITSTLREKPTFWQDLTRCLFVPAKDCNATDSSFDPFVACFGRFVRGLVISIVTCEWHLVANMAASSRQTVHSEVFMKQVIQKLQTQPLGFAQQWHNLPSDTVEFVECCRSLSRGNWKRTFWRFDQVPEYHQGLLCDVLAMNWQLSPVFTDLKSKHVLERLKLLNVLGAKVHSQHFLLAKWRKMMEFGVATTTQSNKRELVSSQAVTSRPRLTFIGSDVRLSDLIREMDVIQQTVGTDWDFLQLCHLRNIVELLMVLLSHESLEKDQVWYGMGLVATTLTKLVDCFRQATALSFGATTSALDQEQTIWCNLVPNYRLTMLKLDKGLRKTLVTISLLLLQQCHVKETQARAKESGPSFQIEASTSTVIVRLMKCCLDTLTLVCSNPSRKRSAAEASMDTDATLEEEEEEEEDSKLFDLTTCLWDQLIITQPSQHFAKSDHLQQLVQFLQNQHGLMQLIQLAITELKSGHVGHQHRAFKLFDSVHQLVVGDSLQHKQMLVRVLVQEQFLRFVLDLVPFFTSQLDGQFWRGYDEYADVKKRCMVHKTWCVLLNLLSDVVSCAHQQNAQVLESVLDFMCKSEPTLRKAMQCANELDGQRKLSLALVEEMQHLLRLLVALSDFEAYWRERMPHGMVFLMEQSRVFFRKASVLVGDGSRKHRFVQQTLLFDYTQAVTTQEKQSKTSESSHSFQQRMQTELLRAVWLASGLLLKMTPAVQRFVVLHGQKQVDDEAGFPILSFDDLSQSGLKTSPSIGHAGLVMEYCLGQLASEPKLDKSSLEMKALETCTLLFVKNYLLHCKCLAHDPTAIRQHETFLHQMDQKLAKVPSIASELAPSWNLLRDK